MSNPVALVIDDDPGSLEGLADLVRLEGFDVVTAVNLVEGQEMARSARPDVVLSDLVLPDGVGLDLVAGLAGEATELIFITGNASVDTALEALRGKACDYMVKPVDVDRLKSHLGQIRRATELKQEAAKLRSELRRLGRFGTLVGTSEPMQRVYDLIEKVGATNAGVFIYGESGTGKELVAELIHRLSPRRDEPFLALNCGAVAQELIESELFGHEKGSFTGAERLHRGHFERCHRGTLFLDEVTEMPLDLQVKLLRVLESSRFLRVGGDAEIEVDVRVIAATNRDPDEAVLSGKLRKDLLYRVKVFPIELPALTEREDDIVLLAKHFLAQLDQREGTSKRFSDAALNALRSHGWPGNVRELRNAVERAHILAADEVRPEDLPELGTSRVPAKGRQLSIDVGSSFATAEKAVILATLAHVHGDRRAAAKTLGVSLKTIYNRLKEYRECDARENGSAPPEDEPIPDEIDEGAPEATA